MVQSIEVIKMKVKTSNEEYFSYLSTEDMKEFKKVNGEDCFDDEERDCFSVPASWLEGGVVEKDVEFDCSCSVGTGLDEEEFDGDISF